MERGVNMAVRLTDLGTRRFIGDTATMLVHDRWNSNCEDCLMDVLIEKGTARGFNPDQSDQAFWEDYEYCPHCFDRSDPEPPSWARTPEGVSKDERETVASRLQSDTPDK